MARRTVAPPRRSSKSSTAPRRNASTDTRLRISLHSGQLRVRASRKKLVLAIAGTGGGKTSYAPIWAFEERERCKQAHPDDEKARSGLVVAPYKILVRTTIPAFLDFFQTTLQLGEWENRGDMIWRFHDGGYIYFASADTPESIEGAHVGWAVMDEMGQRQFPEASFNALERRVRFYSGRILGVTTPYVLGWLKDLDDAVKAGKRDDVDIIKFPSNLNPQYPTEEFERARRTMVPWKFRMYHLGEWDRPAGLVYGDVDDSCWTTWDDMPAGYSNWPVFAGADFGYNNPTALVYGLLSPDDVLYIVDEYYARERTDTQNALFAPCDNVQMTWADPSSPEAIAEFLNNGHRITKCPAHEVTHGITEVLERVHTGRLKFIKGALEFTALELDGYVWDDKKPDAPVKHNDHACFVAGTMVTTPTGNVPIEALRVGDEVLTRSGTRRVLATGNREAEVAEFGCVCGSRLVGTPDHPVWTGEAFLPIDALRYTDLLWHPTTTAKRETFGVKHTARSRRGTTSTIEMGMSLITSPRIFNYFRGSIILACMEVAQRLRNVLHTWRGFARSPLSGMAPQQAERGMLRTASVLGQGGSLNHIDAGFAGGSSPRPSAERASSSALTIASRRRGDVRVLTTRSEDANGVEPASSATSTPVNVSAECAVRHLAERRGSARVYNISVEGEHEYFANNILVSNCDALRYMIWGLKKGRPQPLVNAGASTSRTAALRPRQASPDDIYSEQRPRGGLSRLSGLPGRSRG